MTSLIRPPDERGGVVAAICHAACSSISRIASEGGDLLLPIMTASRTPRIVDAAGREGRQPDHVASAVRSGGLLPGDHRCARQSACVRLIANVGCAYCLSDYLSLTVRQ
jgi:putative intracellular protease/amidase